MSTKTISFYHRVGGVLTNVTTILLRDPTATFGLKRTDTGAILITAGADDEDCTELTQQSTGVYSHTFTEPAAGLTYLYHLEWVYAGETFRVERTLLPTPSLDASSYCTLSEANNIANTLPGLASFKAATDDAKTAALLLATMDLDAAGPWQGRRYSLAITGDDAQLLEFPRVAYESGGSGFGVQGSGNNSYADLIWDLDEDGEPVVPLDVKRACVYQANSIIAGQLEAALEAMWVGVASRSAGSVSVSYRDPSALVDALGATSSGGLDRRAAALMKKYILKQGKIL